MKRVLSLVSLIVIVGFLFVFAYPIAASSAISMKSDAIQETLDAYFEILYNKRANLLIGDQLSKGQQTLCTATFPRWTIMLQIIPRSAYRTMATS